MAELEESYGVRMGQARERLYPSAIPTTLPPRDTAAPQVPPELLAQLQPQAGGIDKKFPDVVYERQGSGPKLDRASLEGIRDQYRTERVTPWAAGQKGADKDYIAAQEAAYDSKANDWIEKYLAEGAQATGPAGTPETGSGREGGLGATLTGFGEIIPAALKSLADIVPDLGDLANYGLRNQIGTVKALPEAATAISEGRFGDALRTMAASRDVEQGKKNVLDEFGQGYRGVTKGIKDAFTSQATLDAMEGLGQLLDRDDVTAGQVLTYIKDNPSVANQIGGDLIGQLAPMVLTGGGSTAIRGTALAQRLSEGTRLARFAGRMLENLPLVTGQVAQQTGRGLGGLREEIDNVPLAELLASPQNQTIYDTYRKELGMPEKDAEQALRNTIYSKSADTIAASNAAAGAVTLGVGAPLERAVAALPASRQALRAATTGGGLRRVATAAGKGASEEVLESLPQDVGQNIAENQYRGTNDSLSRGIAANAAINALAGGGVGAITSRKPATPAAPAPEATDTGTADPTATPTPAAPVTQAQTPPGAGLEDTEHKKILKTVVNAAKAAKDVKDALKGIATADEFLGGVQTFLEEEIPASWANMTPAQRLAATETAAGEFMRAVKNEDVKTGVTSKLADQRAAMTAAPAAPAPESTAAAPEPAPAPAPVEATGTPAPAPKTKAKPLRAAKSAAPAPTVTPEQKAAEDSEVIKLDTPQPTAAPKAEAPKVETPAVEQTADEPKLPSHLSKSKPTYGLVKLTFDSDIDRAAYGSTGKAGAEYRAWLKEGGFTDAGINQLREQIKTKLKSGVKDNQKAGNVRIATTYKTPAGTVSTAATVKPEAKATKPLKKDAATIAAEKEAAAQDEADKVKAKTDKLKTAAGKVKAAKPEPKPLKKEGSKPPKQEAPADKPGQVAQPAPTNEAPTTARETPEKAVERIAPELEGSDKTNVTEGVRIARESGDMTDLNQALRDLGDTVDADTKRAIRESARQTTPKEEGLTEKPDEPKEMPKAFGTAKEAFDHARDNNLGAAGLVEGLRRTKDIAPHLSNILDKIESLVASADIKLVDFTPEEISSLKKTGIDPNNLGGVYRMFTNTLTLAKGGVPEATHELVHAVTSNALAQQADDPRITKLQQEMEDLRQYLRAYIKNHPGLVEFNVERLRRKTGPLGNTREMVAYGLTDANTISLLRKIPAPPNSKLSNAWQELVRIVADFLGVDSGDRSAFDDLADITGRLIDVLNEDPAELSRARLRTTLGKVAANVESQPFDFAETSTAQPVTAAAPVPITKAEAQNKAPLFLLDRVWEIFNNAALGLERAMQLVEREGGKITAANNPYIAWRRFTSHVNETRKQDSAEVIEPIANWLTQNMGRFGETDPETFRQNLDKFLQNHHALNERNPTVWAETVKLKDGKDVKRALILRKARDGKITGAEMNSQLIALAKQHAATPQDEWAKTNAARDPDRARKVLADLAKKGYKPDNLGDLNSLLQSLRDRKRMRMERAGIITPKDPFSDRGWKWYVPLKGSVDADEKYADYDVGSSRGSTRVFRKANPQVMKGRSTNASNALEQMAVDMNNAATHEAEAKFKEAIYRFATQNKRILGTQVRAWEGTPKDGYTTQQAWARRKPGEAPRVVLSKKTRSRGELPNPTNGFIYNDGDTHYEVQLPDDSLLMRGLRGPKNLKYINQLEEQHGAVGTVFRGAGFITNMMARLQTTLMPTWTLATAFMRDTNALPATIAMEVYDTPVQAANFFAHYAKNLSSNVLASPKNWRAEWAIIRGDEKTLADYAQKNPDSFPAKVLEYRKAGGSTEYAQGLNREAAGDVLFGKLRKSAEPRVWKRGVNTLRKGVDTVNDVTGNWAQLLELKARVAAYESLKANGIDEGTAAATVKGALDFGQSGEIGKLINAMHAYYRVSATAADTLRRITTDKKGFFDAKKTATWGGFMAAVGYAQYMLLASVLGDDEDEKDENGNPVKRINKFDINTLTQNVLIPDGKGGVLPYKIGLGLPQLMAAPGIIAAHMQNGAITPKEAIDAYYDVFTRNYPAIQPEGQQDGTGAAGFLSSWAKGLLPSAVKPFVESETNTSRFDRPIRTAFPRKDRPASAQGMPETADEFKNMAKTLYEDYGVDMYPETIRHFITQYGGQPAGEVIRWTVDRHNKEEQGLEMPAARTALKLSVNDEDFYYRKEARQAANILQAASAQVKYHETQDEDEGREWIRNNPGVVKRKEAFTKLDSARDAYYKELAGIRGNKLMSAEGKALARKKADAKLREATNVANKVIADTEE